MKIHLNEDQIIRAIVSEQDLPASLLAHLYACGTCQDKKQGLERELEILESMAGAFTPLPRRRRLKNFKKARRLVFFPIQRPAFAAGLAALLFLMALWWPWPFADSPGRQMAQMDQEREEARPLVAEYVLEEGPMPTPETLTQRMEEDQQLMREICELEEHALPDFYLNISGEPYDYVDEEFLDFVVPSEETRLRPSSRVGYANSPR